MIVTCSWPKYRSRCFSASTGCAAKSALGLWVSRAYPAAAEAVNALEMDRQVIYRDFLMLPQDGCKRTHPETIAAMGSRPIGSLLCRQSLQRHSRPNLAAEQIEEQNNSIPP